MSKRRSIAILDPSVAVTGAFSAAQKIAETLKEQADWILILPKGSAIRPSAPFSAVHYVPIMAPSKRFSVLLRYGPALIASSLRLRRLLRGHEVDMLVINDFYLPHSALLRLLGYRGRIITMVRCSPRNMMGPLAGPLLRLARLGSSQLVAVSQWVREQLPQADEVPVIYDAFNGQPRASKRFAADEIKPLVYIGNYIPGKGQDVALEAFAKVHARDSSLRLDFYGGDMGLAKNKAYLNALKQRASELGVEEQVRFHGFTDDIADVLAGSFAALNCSVSESFSLTVLEASGNGLPVVATRCGGPEEILVDSETGYLVSIGDAEAVAERLLQLAAEPALAARMGEAGTTHVAERFSPDAFSRAWLALLEAAE